MSPLSTPIVIRYLEPYGPMEPRYVSLGYNLERDAHAAGVIRREVIAKNRRALVIYGDGHLQGRGMPDNQSLVYLLEQPPTVRIFVVSNFFGDLERVQPNVTEWPVPSLANVRGTTIGVHPYAFFYPIPPAPGWNILRMEQQFDAVLYLGPRSTMTMEQLPKSLCQDKAYMAMRFKRHRLNATLQNPDPGAGLRLFCSVPSQDCEVVARFPVAMPPALGGHTFYGSGLEGQVNAYDNRLLRQL